MRILILGINYSPELTGIGKYSGEMAEWLTADGHEVTMVTAPPYYPQWKVDSRYSSVIYRKEEINGVNVTRCPIYVPAQPTGLKRILHLASFSISSFPVMIAKYLWKPDIVLTIEPTLFCAPTALIVAKLSRAKCWLHIQDFEIDAAFDLGIIKNKKFRSIIRKIECWLLNRFDRVSTISSKMIGRLELKNIAAKKRILFPNWVDLRHISPLSKPSKYRDILSIGVDTTVALYSGNMGEKQGLEILFEAAKQLETNDKIKFVVCGQGATYDRFHSAAHQYTNIYWLPLQPLEDLNELLGLADIHLLPQKAEVNDLLMPSKLTGMLASGRPTVATANKDTQVYSIVSRFGEVVPPNDTQGFINAINKLAENRVLCKELGNSGRKYAEQSLNSDIILKKFNENLSILSKT